MDASQGMSVVFSHDDVEVLHVPHGNPSDLRCHRFLDTEERTFGIRLEIARLLQENIALFEELNDLFGYNEAVSRLLKELFLSGDQPEKPIYVPIRIMQKLREARRKIATMVFDELDDFTVANMQKKL